MAKWVYWLKEIHRSDTNIVGGKGANMGDLARGLNVPDGFCLSSKAYYDNLKYFGINEKIGHSLKGLNMEDMKAVNRASTEISELIIQTPLLPEVEDAVTTAFGKLAEGKAGVKVAVRSSATAEDLVDSSFAGQQETYLDVDGVTDVLLAVKKCWASLWTPRAIHYRNQKGFEHKQVKMAVIIQEMVPAAVAGVMFTADPLTNSRHHLRIEAVRGLGEQLVSGDVSGDVYVFKKNEPNVELIQKSVSDPAQGQMINDYDLRELAHTGMKIELFYEDYQDIEWAYYQGKFYFLQTRPITTLADEALPEIDLDKMNKLQHEVMDWVAERFPEPILPIDGIVVKLLFMAQFEAMQTFGYTIEDMDWSRVERGVFPEFFTPPKIKPGLKGFWLNLRLNKTLKSDPAGEWAGEQVYLLDMLKKLKGRDISGLPIELVLDYITEAFHHFHYFIVMRYKYFAQNRTPSALLLKFLKYTFKDRAMEIYENLLACSDNVTMVINTGLKDLANQAGECPRVCGVIENSPLQEILAELSEIPEAAPFLEKFNDFMALYGERETTMGLGGIASPTWQDAPEVVFGIIRSMLSEEPGMEQVREEDRKQRVREAEAEVNARLSRGVFSFLRLKPLYLKVLKQARSFSAFRENSHYDVTRSLHVFRILFTELGRRFVRQGVLQNPLDIFYLSYFEIREIILTIFHGLEDVNVKTLAAKIESRKAEQERRLARWSLRNTEFDETGALKGAPVSHGIVSGPARIVKDPRDFYRVQKGDILIAPYTNPAWTPLFTTAAGLVAETGGAASHAAIIAREYGIPAVMGVVKATEVLQDGEIITVNGGAGTVYRGQGTVG